jgi:2-polyprenyl-3-methyl-5-hydroxy-6-metoxy-1,4-benzoquinol methylase
MEKNTEFYNIKYQNQEEYKLHYKNSWYFVHWTQIIRYLRGIDDPKILEIGCGTGQLANYLIDEGFNKYVGFDFSEEAIKIAKERINLEFFVGDALNPECFQYDYNLIICTEVLEHIKDDISVLKNIRKGSKIIFSVPNFDEESHVRWFLSERQIKLRYFKYIDILHITRVGNIYIVLGERSDFNANVFQRILATREAIGISSISKRLTHRVKNFLKIKTYN